MKSQEPKEFLKTLVDAAVGAVDPRRLTADAVRSLVDPPTTVIAIGKAAPAMAWGAVDALGRTQGLCVAAHDEEVPAGIELIVGDHPVPGNSSLEAARRACSVASKATDGVLALISGGGSSLCEMPMEGLDFEDVAHAYAVMLDSSLDISDMNLARMRLSGFKNGGLAQRAAGPVTTLVISDVWPHGPEVVASAPTIPGSLDCERADHILSERGLSFPLAADDDHSPSPTPAGPVVVVADARTAGHAVVNTAVAAGIDARLSNRPIVGDIDHELDRFLGGSEELLVAVGEPTIEVSRHGSGGRNTHAALLAAARIADTETLFVAVATDGVDGRSGSAGAIVDGATVKRGGLPDPALKRFDSGTYLARTGDLLPEHPTGTNVGDLWMIYRPTGV